MVDQGIKSNRIMGETTTDRIASAVVKSIKKDLPAVVDAGTPLRPLLALGEVAPRTLERIVSRSGATQLFRKVAKERGKAE
ncbi:MAG: hypothetical protein QOI98_2363 [Solirubrobacteraceae bacterium]|nr:hypothetical protein [Solirubrobacteraceae bacterium]